MITPAEVMDATTEEVSIETEVAFRAAHSSPLAKVPVWTIVTDPGAGVVSSPLFSSAENSSQVPPVLASVELEGVNKAD